MPTFKAWQPVAGFDCPTPHEYPPACLCDSELCQAWMEKYAAPDLCESEHAHELHYWWLGGSAIYRCAGRQFCAPKYQPTLMAYGSTMCRCGDLQTLAASGDNVFVPHLNRNGEPCPGLEWKNLK